jgi:hypothetical protein
MGRHLRRDLGYRSRRYVPFWARRAVVSSVGAVESYPYLGIEGYWPEYLRGLMAISTMHRQRLAGLVGRRLTRGLLLWDQEREEWFADAPVLLDFAGEQLEIQHNKFDELSLTWNTTNPVRPVRFPEFDLSWRTDVSAGLTALEGQILRHVWLLEWRGRDMAEGMVAVHLRFDDGQATVYNALDENGLSFDQPEATYAWHAIE